MLATDTTTFLLEPHLPFFKMVVSLRLKIVHSVEIDNYLFSAKITWNQRLCAKITLKAIFTKYFSSESKFQIFHTV